MENGLKADTLRLSQQSDLLMREYRTADLLREQLRMLKRLMASGDPSLMDPLIRTADKLTRYFKEMSGSVEHIESELEHMSLEIKMILEDAGRQGR